MMYIKIHEAYRLIVALCDSDILGKKFEEGNMQLDISERFYKGEELKKEEIVELIKRYARDDATFIIAGKESISAAMEAGIISKDAPKKIAGIPHALILV